MKTILTLIVGLLMLSPVVHAKQVHVEFELPEFDVADYRKPYVAIWSESKKEKETYLLWHLKRKKEDKWLVDIRRWWRKQGRYGETPDGVTGATKGPGVYKESFEVNQTGPFTLFIEVVREDGGRSLLKQKIDFSKSNKNSFEIAPSKELGAVTIRF